MRSLLVFCSLASLLLIGCNLPGSNNTTNSSANSSNKDGNPSFANRAKPGGDFSTPKAAVQTFITAGTNRDKELLSQCFHPDSAGEFRKLREKTSTPEELADLANFVGGGVVGDAEERGDRALVKVAFKKRNEEISMKKLEGDWKIVDF